MNTTKTFNQKRSSFQQTHNVIYFNRKPSLQFDQKSNSSVDKNTKQNFLSSYPILQPKKSKIMTPPAPQQNCQQFQLQRKKSSFLKNYNQKLKRQRKRQIKLKSSLKQFKNNHNNSNVNKSINSRDQLHHYTTKKPYSTLSQHLQTPSTILVFRKTQFLDTLSSSFKQNKSYQKDSSLQSLLKEIYDIKNQQKKQIQRINKQKITIQQEISSKKRNNKNNDSYFTKYQTGFLLPMRRKILYTNSPLSQTQSIQKAQNSLIKQRSGQRGYNIKNIKERTKLQKIYNFKQIDPWQNPSHRDNNQSFDNHFLFNTIQNL